MRGHVDEQREMMYSNAWQLLQEHIDDAYSTNPGTDRIAQEVWGPRYVDDAVVRRMRTTSGNVDPTTYYHITDAQFSTMAMLQGAVLKERVEFDAYGRARHYWASDVDGDGAVTQGDQNAITAAANANPQLQIGALGYNVAMDINRDGVIDLLDVFAFVAQANRPALAAGQISDPAGPDNLIGYDGYVFNMENILYTVRFRHYDPQLGRWVQRDPLKNLHFDSLNFESASSFSPSANPLNRSSNNVELNNLYQFVQSTPAVALDPSGLKCCIAVRCGNLTKFGITYASHCGLVFCDNNGCYTYDGSGGKTHDPIIDPFNLGNPSNSKSVGPMNCNFPDSTCQCLRNEKKRWSQMNIPRDNMCANSNWHLNCVTKKCKIKITWGNGVFRKPRGWDCPGYVSGRECRIGDPYDPDIMGTNPTLVYIETIRSGCP